MRQLGPLPVLPAAVNCLLRFERTAQRDRLPAAEPAVPAEQPAEAGSKAVPAEAAAIRRSAAAAASAGELLDLHSVRERIQPYAEQTASAAAKPIPVVPAAGQSEGHQPEHQPERQNPELQS